MADDMAITLFQQRLKRGMERVQLILNSEKKPSFAADVHHQYEDKYLLAESATTIAIASQLNCLAELGLTMEKVSQLHEWAKTKAVSLRFRSEERCTFDREQKREIEDPTQNKAELSVGGVVKAALTSKVVTTVTEYFWKFEVSYELSAIRGVGEHETDKILIRDHIGHCELKTSSNKSPHPETRIPASCLDVNISWLIRQLQGDKLMPQFQIDREHIKCHTPRRNPDISEGLTYFTSFLSWQDGVVGYLRGLFTQKQSDMPKLDLDALSSSTLFVPVLPLLHNEAKLPVEGDVIEGADDVALSTKVATPFVMLFSSPSGAASAVLCLDDLNLFLAEEMRMLKEKHVQLVESFPPPPALATSTEAVLLVTLMHSNAVCSQWAQTMDYIENMLRKQLIAAIGKEVTPRDFAEYMTFHNRKLFTEHYAPSPFCFAVRRSERHSPEGTISIELSQDAGDDKTSQATSRSWSSMTSGLATPLMALVARNTEPHSMQFPINASTNVTFGGDRYLHAWLSHSFSGQPGPKLVLASRARQFSSYIVLVGSIASANTFEPKHAFIVRNKDEITIPLDLSTIPTAKEFKDAIESLSPEQQSFARAFRSMQLESTLFGILVIQIKPQLERVLNLPDDSLTKEIKLTQELMNLFITYQIPSDLLSFDGEVDGFEVAGTTVAVQLESVKDHVKAINEMITESKKQEIEERKREYDYAHPVARNVTVQRALRSCNAAPFADLAEQRECMRFGQSNTGLERASDITEQQGIPQQREVQSFGEETTGRNYTQVPGELDERLLKLDTESSVHSTIITTTEPWTKREQRALLAEPTTSSVWGEQMKKEKDAAFDLLDALTKSGALIAEHASLHIVIAATHCFDKTVVDTIVQDGINPIDKVEKSTLIMASTVHQQPVATLIRDGQHEHIRDLWPALLCDDTHTL